MKIYVLTIKWFPKGIMAFNKIYVLKVYLSNYNNSQNKDK